MKKRTLLIVLVLGLICNLSVTKAQHGRFSLAPEVGIPMGDFGKYYGPAFGISFRYEHPIGDKMGLTFTTGYLISAASGSDFANDDFGVIGMLPLQAGFKYYIKENQDGFYVMANLGIHASTVAASGALESLSATALSYGPEFGYALEHWDFGIRYQFFGFPTYDYTFDPINYTYSFDKTTSTESYIAIRAAFVFGSRD